MICGWVDPRSSVVCFPATYAPVTILTVDDDAWLLQFLKAHRERGRSCLKAWFSGHGEDFNRQETPMLHGIVHNELQGFWVFGFFAEQIFSSEIPLWLRMVGGMLSFDFGNAETMMLFCCRYSRMMKQLETYDGVGLKQGFGACWKYCDSLLAQILPRCYTQRWLGDTRQDI